MPRPPPLLLHTACEHAFIHARPPVRPPAHTHTRTISSCVSLSARVSPSGTLSLSLSLSLALSLDGGVEGEIVEVQGLACDARVHLKHILNGRLKVRRRVVPLRDVAAVLGAIGKGNLVRCHKDELVKHRPKQAEAGLEVVRWHRSLDGH